MPQAIQRNDMSKGVNLDLDEIRLPENAALFLKNVTRNVNLNSSAASLAGSNLNVVTPIEGTTRILMTPPTGTNYCIGSYSSEQTNELYFFLYNSNQDHSIWVIRGDTGVIQKVYQSSLLNFQLDPQYFISEGRCTLELQSYVDPATGKETSFKFLIFTDNYNEPRFISVEDSIATSSYTLPSPYFTGAGTFYIPETLITLAVPTPLKCIGINTPIAYAPVTGSTGIGASIIDAAGINYAAGDTFNVDAGSPIASGIVLSVDESTGAVTS